MDPNKSLSPRSETRFNLFFLNIFKIDIKSKSKVKNIINGGRYDKLISDLGYKKKVPAVGAALNLN